VSSKGICVLRLLLLGIIGLLLSCPTLAQDREAQRTGQELAASALADIEQNITLSQQQMQEIAQEIDLLKKDEKSLSEALVSSVAKTRQLDNRLRERGQRLASLLAQKSATQKLLSSRRGEVASTLAILERMGLQLPPAILAHPDDVMRSLRSSSLLKSVMVTVQTRMHNVRTDLEKIEQIESLIATEKAQIETDLQLAQIEKQRLQGLLDEKKTAQQNSQQRLTTLQEQNAALAKRAQSLSELIEALGGEELDPDLDTENKPQLVPIDEHFSRQRGQLHLPVSGIKIQSFEKKRQGDFYGELYETASGALVITPVDGVVRYAGSFRSYGHLLILDIGENYHLVLAGMGQIHVQQGQILLAGEPVGMMPVPQPSESQDNGEQVAPTLYVELRKDGTPIDPTPWWAGES